MQQEAADELLCVQCHPLHLIAMGVIPPAEGNFSILQREEPVVRDSHTVGVSSKIVNYFFDVSKGRLGIDYPILPIARIQKRFAWSWDMVFQKRHEFSSELCRENTDREKEFFLEERQVRSGVNPPPVTIM